MTDSTGSTAYPAGWYADPSGSPRQRWWDGAQWTEHLHDTSLEVYGATPPSIVGPGTPVYNVFIGAIVGLALLGLVNTITIDPSVAVAPTRPGEFPVYNTRELLSELLGWLAYGATVTLAFFDRRRLARDGFSKPFHWAWAFLSSAVYVIGRSVIVRRRAGRGLALMWVWVAITGVTLVVAVIKITEMVSAVLPQLELG